MCPASFDLGEDYRVTLMATTEGDDKPKKYPRMFLTSDMMLVSKSDLLPYLPFSVDAVVKDAREVNHKLEVMQISSLKDEITMAVMVGELETERDAERIRETGMQALQIVTGGI